ncbi:hypothetical protein AB0I49_31640 [Streptomyces sp. NPDC050617]|uniref:hypothetical protein n=1 Tax=Streptomyces sp. NPDC050617 TaxID=3154628 RepID=UPI0034165D2F
MRDDASYCVRQLYDLLARRNPVPPEVLVPALKQSYFDFQEEVREAFRRMSGTSVDVAFHLVDAHRLEQAVRLRGRRDRIISLDPLIHRDVHRLRVSRGFLIGGSEPVGIVAGQRHRPMREQLGALAAAGHSYTLVDDDIITGSTVSWVIRSLHDAGVRVRRVVPGIRVTDTDRSSIQGVPVEPVLQYRAVATDDRAADRPAAGTGDRAAVETGDRAAVGTGDRRGARAAHRPDAGAADGPAVGTDVRAAHRPAMEVVDTRNFLLGVSGLVVQAPDGEWARAPYWLPFVSTSARSGISPESDEDFAVCMLVANTNFFSRVGHLLGTPVRILDLHPMVRRLLSSLAVAAPQETVVAVLERLMGQMDDWLDLMHKWRMSGLSTSTGPLT